MAVDIELNGVHHPKCPKTPYNERIFWTPEERLKVIDAWIDIIQADPHITAVKAVTLAMEIALEPERRRDPKSFGSRDHKKFADEIHTRLEARTGEPLGEWVDREEEEETEEVETRRRIVWTKEEEDDLVAAGVDIIRADITGRIKMPEVLRRAQMVAFEPDRRRKHIQGHRRQWFYKAVEEAISGPPRAFAPTPEPITAEETGFETPKILTEPKPVDVPDLDGVGLIAVGLGRLVEERDRATRRDEAMLSEVRGLLTHLSEVERKLTDRIAPLEESAAMGNLLLRTVLKSLDPELLRSFDASRQTLDPVIPVSAAPAPPPPQQLKPVMIPRPPKCNICVVGLRPVASAKIRSEVESVASISSILDESQAQRHDYRQYDAIVITRHAGHATHERILSQVDKSQVIRVRNTGLESVTEAINDLSARHRNAWNAALDRVGATGSRAQ